MAHAHFCQRRTVPAGPKFRVSWHRFPRAGRRRTVFKVREHLREQLFCQVKNSSLDVFGVCRIWRGYATLLHSPSSISSLVFRRRLNVRSGSSRSTAAHTPVAMGPLSKMDMSPSLLPYRPPRRTKIRSFQTSLGPSRTLHRKKSRYQCARKHTGDPTEIRDTLSP